MEKIEGVGQVCQFNRSLYLLIPQEIAEEMGVKRHTRWQMTRNNNSLTYHFRKEREPKTKTVP